MSLQDIIHRTMHKRRLSWHFWPFPPRDYDHCWSQPIKWSPSVEGEIFKLIANSERSGVVRCLNLKNTKYRQGLKKFENSKLLQNYSENWQLASLANARWHSSDLGNLKIVPSTVGRHLIGHHIIKWPGQTLMRCAWFGQYKGHQI